MDELRRAEAGALDAHPRFGLGVRRCRAPGWRRLPASAVMAATRPPTVSSAAAEAAAATAAATFAAAAAAAARAQGAATAPAAGRLAVLWTKCGLR